MEIFSRLNIDFMGKRRVFLTLSALVIVGALFLLFTTGINQGVEFTGGAHVILRYVDPPRLADVRQQLLDAGLSGGSVTAFGDTGGREIVVRVPLPEKAREEAERRDLALRVANALRPADVVQRVQQGQIDLNVADHVTVARHLVEQGGLSEEQAEAAATILSDAREQQQGLFESVEEAASLEGMPEEAAEHLRNHAFVGPFALRGQEFIESSVSKEMQNKAIGAVFGALLGMLVYIWIRFKLVWGLGAIVALMHDTVITLGAFSLAGLEADLPVVAAFLTVVGYSVNDTIVIFDRIRENLATRGAGALAEVINLSVNQSLSRTVITSLTTLFVVVVLFLFGGPVLRPFSFVILIGVIVGTYSSVYVASPVVLFLTQRWAHREASGSARQKPPRVAKRVQN